MTPTPKAQQRTPLVPSSALQLEDLITEIRQRAAGLTDMQARLGELLTAVVGISANLELSEVLRRIVESACALVEARYGALGVLDESGLGLAEFITHGMSEQQRARMGHVPRGVGVIGLLIRDARTYRFADLTDHPDSVGFPPHHPPMRTFVGTPIRVRDKVFGNLYLTEKSSGAAFSTADAAILEGLASAAGIAIENAQMYRRAKGQQEWSDVVAELTQTLLEGRNERTALARMLKHARDLGGADLGVLAVRDDEGDLAVTAVERRAGEGRPCREDCRLRDPRWEILVRERVPLLLVELHDGPAMGQMAAELAACAGLPAIRAATVVPVTVGEVEVGLIALAWVGDGHRAASETMELLTSFAARMGLAIEASRGQRQRSRARLLEERERIARDMHDHVIQRLFAAGLSLQAGARQAEGPLRLRLDGVIDELDLSVREIREAIFQLQQQLPDGGLGPQIESLVAQAADAFGFVPDLTFEGLLADVPPELEQEVLAVVREGLANIERHACASDAYVRVSTVDDLVVTIQDNGVGLDSQVCRRGLVNLESRALAHGGTFSATRRSPTGTHLRWRVPLHS